MDNQQRDSDIALGYLAGQSAAKLGREYRLSVVQVRRILSAKKISRGEDIVKQDEGSKVINPLHRKLGHKLYTFRFMKNLETLEAAEEMGWSAKRLKNVEQGYKLLTLIDLVEMAQFMDTPLTELLKGL